MVKLAFVIPTWNRPKFLEPCIESIAKQIEPGMDVVIRVLDDASDDPGVQAVIDRLQIKYDCIEFSSRDEHGDHTRSFRYAFKSSPDAEWVWTFGDDDLLREGALKFMLDDVLPKMAKRKFFHVAELGRESGANKIMYGPLLALCCEYGWIDMTGFISGNVTRGEWLNKAANTPNWSLYAKSAFVQSCALLETLRDEECALVDIPLIRVQPKTPEDLSLMAADWVVSNTAERYVYLVDAIEYMFDREILKEKLPPAFFRYLNLHLWDRFIIGYLNDFNTHKAIWTDDVWGRVTRFCRFVNDEEMVKKTLLDLEQVRGLATLILYMRQSADHLHNQIGLIGTRHNGPFFPYTFIEPVAPPQTTDSDEPSTPDTAEQTA